MRILYVTSHVPDRGGMAVHVVAAETVRVMSERGHEVVLQIVIPAAEGVQASPREKEALERLKASGVEVLPPLDEATVVGLARRRSRRFIATTVRSLIMTRELLPSVAFRAEIARRMEQVRPDVILIHATSEGLAATSGINAVPKVAHYGTVSHWPTEARLRCPALFGIPSRSLRDKAGIFLAGLVNHRLNRVHVRILRECFSVPIPDARMASFYTKQGHPRAFYIQNMWPDAYGRRWRLLREQHGMNGLKIVGNIGSLAGTGTTFGLYFLGREVLPQLDRRLGNTGFEVHLYGRGPARTPVADVLHHPRIRIRGHVPDLDAEVLSSQIFLTVNNSGPFRGGHTRIQYAWSLGSCVIAHRNYQECIPELAHMDNVLMGESADEIADLVAQAASDQRLCSRIAEAGRATYERYFTPEVVVPKLLAELELAVHAKAGQTTTETHAS